MKRNERENATVEDRDGKARRKKERKRNGRRKRETIYSRLSLSVSRSHERKDVPQLDASSTVLIEILLSDRSEEVERGFVLAGESFDFVWRRRRRVGLGWVSEGKGRRERERKGERKERRREGQTLAYRSFGRRDGFGGVEDGDVVEELLVECLISVLKKKKANEGSAQTFSTERG